MRMARDMVMERLYYQTAISTSASIVTGLDTVKVFTYSETVPDIMVIGETDANTVKGSFGTLTERDTKVRARMYKNRIRIRFEEVGIRRDIRASSHAYIHTIIFISHVRNLEKERTQVVTNP